MRQILRTNLISQRKGNVAGTAVQYICNAPVTTESKTERLTAIPKYGCAIRRDCHAMNWLYTRYDVSCGGEYFSTFDRVKK